MCGEGGARRKRKGETCKNIALKATVIPGGRGVTCRPPPRSLSLSRSYSLSLSRRFISMVSDSSGKYGILCREGKHKQKPTGIPINL